MLSIAISVLDRLPKCWASRHVIATVLKRYRQSGPLGMNNQSRGRTGNSLLPASLTDQALSIIRELYRDFGPTLAREKLEEVHGLVLGKETIRRLMIKAGLWIPADNAHRKFINLVTGVLVLAS